MATSPSDIAPSASPAGRGGKALAVVWLASGLVLAASFLAAFRLPFADDLPTLLRVNGPRVLFGAAVGAALALSGALRLAAGTERPLRELEILALSTGAAAGGFALVIGRTGTAAPALFVLGASGGALLFWSGVRSLERPKRWTNLALVVALVAMAGIAALAGTYGRARRDVVAPVTAWLLGDLSRPSVASGLLVLAAVVALLAIAWRALGAGRPLDTPAYLAFGLGVGAAGPLVLISGMVPRTVRALASGASDRSLVAASTAAGAATVVAVDAVPRLLVGGYTFPFNLAAAMLAIPILGAWNRTRLRREVGSAGRVFEVAEVALIVGLTLGGAWLAFALTRVIRILT